MEDQRKREEEMRKDLTAKLSVLGGEQQERLAQRRAEQAKLPYISLMAYPIDPDVLERVSKDQSQAAQAVLFYRQGSDARIGAVNPDLPAFQKFMATVKDIFQAEPQVYVISHRSLQSALSRYRRPVAVDSVPEGELRIEAADVGTVTQATSELKELGQHITSLSPTEILTTVVATAVKALASDVHVEPTETEARIRYRIDGVLQDVATIPRTGWQLLLSRVKVLSQLKLNVHAVPQDGSFVLRIGEDTYDLRVSILPGGAGENIVMRILDRRVEALSITDLGMKESDFVIVSRELKRSTGLILVTGPTGSGKTTSLASFIREINTPESKVITLENPIEYRLPGVEQTQVDEDAGYTFARGLRAILRQDPDIVLVGEVRDTETATTAIDAALTGHLVFSTLHTNDAPGAIPRLIDLGVEPFVLAPAINLIVAQRLVRRVCADCAETYTPELPLRERVRDALRGVAPHVFDMKKLSASNLTFYKAVGCGNCTNGYKGRVGIFEVLPVTDKIEELILQSAPGIRIREAAQAGGMTTVLQDGFMKVIAGITTIEEVERVTDV